MGVGRGSASSPLLRQVYANAIGHCNFTDADIVAAIDAMSNVVAQHHWTSRVTVTSLNQPVRIPIPAASQTASLPSGDLSSLG